MQKHHKSMIKRKEYVIDNPKLTAEWDYEKNGDVTLETVKAHSDKKYYWKCANGHSWIASPANRAQGRGCPYCSGRLPIVGENDLATVNPELAAEWDYERNEGVTLEMVKTHSNKKYFWKCKEGHSWQTTPSSRSKGHGCPYCTGQLPIVGETDLATVNPELAAEWDYERNEGITPDMVTAYSNKSVFWKCAKGHSWMSSVASRSKGHGCPYCMGKLPIIGETDLYTVNPQVALEWDYERNKGVTPKMVTAHSDKKYYWKCEKGHSWEASINNRTKGYGCPYCSGRLPIIGETDLQTVNPELASEWNYERNKGVTPEMVTTHSDKKFYWQCKKWHSWVASINNRTNGDGCPYCSGRLPIPGETDLKTENPQVAFEWDYERNKGTTPEMVSAHSSKKYYWRCKKGHSWMASVASRSKGTGCPYCK